MPDPHDHPAVDQLLDDFEFVTLSLSLAVETLRQVDWTTTNAHDTDRLRWLQEQLADLVEHTRDITPTAAEMLMVLVERRLLDDAADDQPKPRSP
jgi:hypothetical protein